MGAGLTAKEKLLVEGQHDWVKLWQVHRHVAEEDLSATLAEVQQKTLDLVESMIAEGLAEVGDLLDHGARFEPWTMTLDKCIRRMRVEYVDRFDERAGWPWTLWLRITNKGRKIGASLEPDYRRWLTEVREQGEDDEALPSKFAPRE